MRLPARSSSSAPVTTRRTSRIIAHFVASASSRHASGTLRETLFVDGAFDAGMAREPGFLRRENEDGREPAQHAVAEAIHHRQRRAALQAGGRFAIERVFPDIEIEGREIGVQEQASSETTRL